ncbi:DUF1573 domain-containing protein [Parabacteroides pacaensis]|uniref:DUF1573 domain-containing protein n=1 Tax=Parabacteroides pacaensis TaxID=2086575 RepID=UPI000D0E84F0|nr:DUF1573 domain-containing protein [Parabacteroides pacaensis]
MNAAKLLFICSIFTILLACKESNKNKITRLVNEWQGKEIIFPENITFTHYGKDTVDYKIPQSNYKILMYVDSIGCTSCKLQLPRWKEFIKYADSVTNSSIPLLVFFHPKDIKEIHYILRRDKFEYPVCIDNEDLLNQKNHFPAQAAFQTFLLDNENKVVAIGNPIHNINVKELYLNLFASCDTQTTPSKTTCILEASHVDMGSFFRNEQREAKFYLKNTGNSPLVIVDTSTTCGCTTVQYDPQPAAAGDSLLITVTYIPKKTGRFEEQIGIKCNATPSTITLSIKGNVL